jgi:N4-gp56 family major capsid protein
MSNNATDFGKMEALRVTKYVTYVMMAGRNRSFWQGESNGLMGRNLSDVTKPVHYVDQMTKTPNGNKAIVPMVLDLTTEAIVNDNKLEGNEESLVADHQEVLIGQIRKAVKSAGRLSDRSTVINFRATAKERLSRWNTDVHDELFFQVASGIGFDKRLNGSSRASSSELAQLPFASQVSAPTSNRKLFAGTATGVSSLTAADTMSWDLLVKAKADAMYRKIKPIRVNGKDTWGVVMNPYQARDLKLDDDYKNAVKDGATKGDTNNLFTGAFVKVDGLALFDHNLVANTYGLTSGVDKWGSGYTVDGAQALLFGAQALGYALVDAPSWDESDSTDYGNNSGIAYAVLMGIVKNVFKTAEDGTKQDFGIISIYTAAKP